MYPREFFETYWRTEIIDEVFVAMPFHDEFAPVWEEAIRPAVEDGSGGKLRARRVDASILSGSIITDILDGIAHSRIVLADISVSRGGKWQGQRNGNVMYEVGLAHAVRTPSEILLIRSDDEQINFDIAQINIHRYQRDDLPSTKDQISRLVADLLRQIQQEKSLKIQRAIDLLDSDSIYYLETFAVHGMFPGPDPKTMGEELLAISNRAALARLQQMGIIRAVPLKEPKLTAYALTCFGSALMRALGLRVISPQQPIVEGDTRIQGASR